VKYKVYAFVDDGTFVSIPPPPWSEHTPFHFCLCFGKWQEGMWILRAHDDLLSISLWQTLGISHDYSVKKKEERVTFW
jgi:hypothetical protein